MAHLEIIPHQSNDDAAVVHAIANITMESEQESRLSRIRLSYQDIRKFHNDRLEARKVPQDAMEYVAEARLQEATRIFWHSSDL
jgi:hypothetical protein